MPSATIGTPEIVELPEQQVASIQLVVPRAQIQEVMDPAIRELYGELQAQGVAPAGPWLTHHFRRPNEVFDFEICVPVSSPVAARGRVKPAMLRATRAAHVTYRGSYTGLAAAWGEFIAWVGENGLVRSADLWEVYVVGPESTEDAAGWRTELYQPLER